MPRCLDKPILTVASKAYADALKHRTSNMPNGNDNRKKYAQSPHMTKPNLARITFDKNEFPALKTSNNQTNKSPPTLQNFDAN